MIEPRPLSPTPTPEVPLPQAPLVRVIAQARFPPILTIRNPDRAAVFQEALRDTYPNLSQDQVHSIELGGGQTPNVSQGLIWRLADREGDLHWRVSLGVDFVALETSSYDNRGRFSRPSAGGPLRGRGGVQARFGQPPWVALHRPAYRRGR